MKSWPYLLVILLGLAGLVALGTRHQKTAVPTPYSSGTKEKLPPGCDPRDRPNLGCDGERPR